MTTQGHDPAGAPRIAVILAGGGARRLDGADKARLVLRGRRLVDIVAERLAAQADLVLIAGPHDYGARLTALEDHEGAPRGPVAGLRAAAEWIARCTPAAAGFTTAPVDGPFLPGDLMAKLSASGTCAYARGPERAHPTFSYWRVDLVRRTIDAHDARESLSLTALAQAAGAIPVHFDDESAFFNINTREDLARAECLAPP